MGGSKGKWLPGTVQSTIRYTFGVDAPSSNRFECPNCGRPIHVASGDSWIIEIDHADRKPKKRREKKKSRR